jgi:hypothetical protein
MHRNFDQEFAAKQAEYGAVSLEMGGHSFTLRDDVRPEVIGLWEILMPDATGTGGEPLKQSDKIRAIDDVFRELITPSQTGEYDALRQTPESPGLMMLIEAATWAIEQITNRPFWSGSDSGTSPTAAANPTASTVQALRVQVGESGISASETA